MFKLWNALEKESTAACCKVAQQRQHQNQAHRFDLQPTLMYGLKANSDKQKSTARIVSHFHKKGTLLRLAVLAGNLLLNPSKVAVRVSGRSYMWIPMLPHAIGSKGVLAKTLEPKITTASVPASKNAKEEDDSTWWLTHCLLSHAPPLPVRPPSSQRSTATSRKMQSPHKSNRHSAKKREEFDQREWAITRALVPRKFQRPSGENTPVPGRPPAWSP